MSTAMSPDERRKLRLARAAIYAAPAVAGLVTVSAMSVARQAGFPSDHGEVGIPAYFANTYRRRCVGRCGIPAAPGLPRAADESSSSFLFAVPMTFFFYGVFVVIFRFLGVSP